MNNIEVGLAEWKLKVKRVEAISYAAEANFPFLQLDLGDPCDERFLARSNILRSCYDVAMTNKITIDAIAVNIVNKIGPPTIKRGAIGETYKHLLNNAIECAVTLGSSAVFFPSFRCALIRSPSDLLDAIDFFKYASDAADRHNIYIASENSLSVEWNYDLLSRTGRDRFKIIWDSLNPLRYGVDTRELLCTFASQIYRTVHIKDGRVDSAESLPLGHGQADVLACVRILLRTEQHLRIVLENDFFDGSACSVADDFDWLKSCFPSFIA